MAAIPQQHTGTEEKGPARAFWDDLMEQHPTLHGILSITGSVLGFFVNGHAVVKAGHWVVITAGRIAETALLFATLWITAVNIAPDFITQLAGGVGNVSTLNALSLMAFSLLPEIIVFSAIVITYEHWQRFFRDQRAGNPAWVWGCLYALPTSTFLIMTVVTLGSFVSRDGATAHITGVAIVIRCLAGWFYALVELIYITLGKRTGYTITTRQVEDRMAEIVTSARATLENTTTTIVNQAITQQIIPALLPLIRTQIDTMKIALLDEQTALLAEIKASILDDQPAQSFDCQRIAEAIVPMFEATVRATIVREVKATIAPLAEPAPRPQLGARRKIATERRDQEESKATDTRSQDEKLEDAYQAMLAEGASISGRALARRAHVNRDYTNDWLKARAKSLEATDQGQHQGHRDANETSAIVVDSEPGKGR